MACVTVGLPFRNDARTLELAIKSVFAQTLTDWELLLIDDGSTDGSLEIAQSVGDARVSVVSDGTNRGLATRLNQIAQRARGIYLARLDGDDAMHPRRLEMQIAALAEGGTDVVASQAYVIDATNEVYGLHSTEPFIGKAADFLRNGLFIHPTIIARTEWFRRNPYDERYFRAQDKELWCRTRRTTTFLKLQAPLLYYREAGNFRLPLYRETCKWNREVIRAYGPKAVGWTQTNGLLITSHAKEWIYRGLSVANLVDILTRRRCAAIDASLAAAAQQVLHDVASIMLPRAGLAASDYRQPRL